MSSRNASRKLGKAVICPKKTWSWIMKYSHSLNNSHLMQHAKGQLHFYRIAPDTCLFFVQQRFHMQPLSLVDEPAFYKLLQVAEPRFQLPHCTYITAKALLETYVGCYLSRQLPPHKDGMLFSSCLQTLHHCLP